MFLMPKAYPLEFRRDVIAVARQRDAPLSQIAKDFGISETCLQRWLRIADRDDGAKPASPTSTESAALKDANKRIRLLEQENEILRRAAAYLSQASLPK
jgi:transposase-like protein